MEVLEAYCNSLFSNTETEAPPAPKKNNKALEQYKHEYFDEPQSFSNKRISHRRNAALKRSSRAKLFADNLNPLAPTLKESLENAFTDKQKKALAVNASIPDQSDFPDESGPLITAFVCNKGGTGKTTACINVAGWLANQGQHILIVDLDPQGSSSSYLAANTHIEVNSSDLFRPEQQDFLKPTEVIKNIDLIPADAGLLMAERDLQINQDSPLLLKTKLDAFIEQQHKDYDFVFIDTPAGMGLLSMSAAASADNIILPMDDSSYAEEACKILLDFFVRTEQYTNKKPDIAMVLLKQQTANFLEKIVREDRRRIAELLANYSTEQLPIVAVPHSGCCQRAARSRMTLADFAPVDKLSRAFLKAANRLKAQRDTAEKAKTQALEPDLQTVDTKILAQAKEEAALDEL